MMRRAGARSLWMTGGCLSLVATLSAAAGGVPAQVGLDDLVSRLGGVGVPTGADVTVAQVEAYPAGTSNYQPDLSRAEFAGKLFFQMSGPSGVSGHATTVGLREYGTGVSIAPDIAEIYLYYAGGWVLGDFLRAGSGPSLHPLNSPDGLVVVNNSWVGFFDNVPLDNDVIRRADYVVRRDGLLIVSGVNNSSPNLPLMTHMYNGIAVGSMDGGHKTGDTLGPYDGPGRMKPEIVAPGQFTSYATPVVSAAAALMIETARTHPDLALNPNAVRTEVQKAVLLAGAVHRPGWTNNPASSGPTRGLTVRPLDDTYGVDLLNVDRSHLVLTGGEQDGLAEPPSFENATNAGWDLATVEPAGQRYWRFDVPAAADEVVALATWHRTVQPGFAAWSVADFDLVLWRVDATGMLVSLMGDPGLPYFAGGNIASQSSADNVEHLFVLGLEPGTYVLEASRADTLGTNEDLAVAWLLPEGPVVPGDLNGDGVIDVTDLLQLLAAWGPCPGCPEDLDGDGAVSVLDLLFLLAGWG